VSITIGELLSGPLTHAEVLTFTRLSNGQLQKWFERKRLPESDFTYAPGRGVHRRYQMKEAWLLFWLSVLSEAGVEVEEGVELAREICFVAESVLLSQRCYRPVPQMIVRIPALTVAELKRDFVEGAGLFADDKGFGAWLDWAEATRAPIPGKIRPRGAPPDPQTRAERIAEMREIGMEGTGGATALSFLFCRMPAGHSKKFEFFATTETETTGELLSWMRAHEISHSLLLDGATLIIGALERLESIYLNRAY
jgi:hypothetical protein